MQENVISVVICTHRRPNMLREAVQSLIMQSAPPETYEVIIVDNDNIHNMAVQKIVTESAKMISIRYLHESRIGLSFARNTGGMNAVSDYICYIDDDAKAHYRYIETALKIVNFHKPDICGGPHYPFYLTPKPKWFLDRYGSDFKGEEARLLNKNEGLNGTNIVFNRKLLDTLGWFNPSLGLKGRKLWYGEETIIIINARKLMPDLKVYYDPNLLVYHFVPVWKMKIKNILKIAYFKGKSQAYFWIPADEEENFRWRAPFNLALTLITLFIKFFKATIFRDRKVFPYWQNYVFEVIAKSFESFGAYFQTTTDFLFHFARKFL